MVTWQRFSPKIRETICLLQQHESIKLFAWKITLASRIVRFYARFDCVILQVRDCLHLM